MIEFNARAGLVGGLLLALPLSAGSASRLEPAIAAIDPKDFLHQIEVLSSDDFEGRSPGTQGENLTVQYLVEQFKNIGLKPGNPDGSYVQSVGMTAYTGKPEASFSVAGRTIPLSFPTDFVAFAPERQQQIDLQASELVFVGYGVTAPEYGWDDFKGVDLHGKTLIMLINDPPVPDPKDPSKLDPRMFGGSAMTYYGRWTYKYEQAFKQGAAAAIIVHETEPAAYPFSVVISSWSGQNFELHSDQPSGEFPSVASWITVERARELFAAAGKDFDTLKKAALSKSFRPVPLGATVHFTVRNSWSDVDSHNVVARIEGSDPKLKQQTIVYSAHWDHFGWNRQLPGSKHDQIFHGAYDNGSGVAALLELARAYHALPHAPKRSIEFIATTGEERGLLGARYYVQHPLYPLRDTLADINMDGISIWGRTRDVELVTSGKSSLDDVVHSAAASMKMTVKNDTHPERGYFYRADHLEFARGGVPVVYLDPGKDVIGKPSGFGEQKSTDYTEHDYHQVTDTIKPDWDLTGATQEMELLLRIGYSVAQGNTFPQWNATAEFKAARDKSLSANP